MLVTAIIFGIILLLLVIFVIQNSSYITLKILFWQIDDVHLSMLLVIFFTVGLIVSAIMYAKPLYNLKKEVKSLKKELQNKVIETAVEEKQVETPAPIEEDKNGDGVIF